MNPRPLQRRSAVSLGLSAIFVLSPAAPLPARAHAAERVDDQFSYRLAYPDDWKDGSKPVKTHLHELLLSSPTGRGVKLGVTVDPVKIDSLEAFGTLEQTTERVLGVERGRDGVKEVLLRANAAEVSEGQPTYYTINYVTDSSRGTKVFCCKYCIANKRLYVLQAQANVDAFDSDEAVRDVLRDLVKSFRVDRV